MKRNVNIPASYLILLKDDKILLSKRKNTWYHDWEYSLVAWHVEFDETFSEAILREAKEEIWISLWSNLQVVHVQHRKSDKDWWWRVHTYFICSSRTGEIKNKEMSKCSELWRFSLDDLPDNIVPCVSHALECFQKRKFYSEFGR